LVLDLRNEEVIHPTNRFLLYAVYPQCSVSIHVLWGLKQQNTVFAVGRSILDRSSRLDIGALMLAHDGGGHEAAGTCQIANDRPSLCSPSSSRQSQATNASRSAHRIGRVLTVGSKKRRPCSKELGNEMCVARCTVHVVGVGDAASGG
jgi:hypothetical protein